MSRRAALIIILVAVALAAAVPPLSACGSQPTAADFVGFWKEPESAKSTSLYIDTAGDDVCAVRYDRFYPTAVRFRYADGKLTYAPVSSDFTDVITYDAGADAVTITSGNGHSYMLSRVQP